MLLFLGYIAVQIAGRASLRNGSVYETNGTPTQMTDVLSPLSIAVGLIFMHAGRNADMEWSWQFWLGETMVIVLFTLNSVETIPRNVVGLGAVSIVSGLLALWFRDKFWNYALVLGFEVFMALFIAFCFPIMEMVLEAVLNEKLKKVVSDSKNAAICIVCRQGLIVLCQRLCFLGGKDSYAPSANGGVLCK